MSRARRPLRSIVLAAWVVASSLLAVSCELLLPDDSDLIGGGGAPSTTGGGGSASASGGGGGSNELRCCTGDLDGGCVGYEIFPTSTPPPTLANGCSDAPWKDARIIEISEEGSTDAICKLLWDPNGPLLYGCCDVTDDDVDAEAHPMPPGVLFGEDGFAYFLSPARTDTYQIRTGIDAEGATAVAVVQGGMMTVDAGVDVGVQAKSTMHSAGGGVGHPGYTIAWSAPLVPMPLDGRLYCQFDVINTNASTRNFFACGSTGDATEWTTCHFATTPP